MLLGGDEIGRTQHGNNNAYCQDNEINWQDWTGLDEHQLTLKTFTSNLIKLRQAHEVFRSRSYIHTQESFSEEKKSARWISPLGLPMTIEDWHGKRNHALGWILDSLDSNETKIILILFNSSMHQVQFQLPPEEGVSHWRLELDTFIEQGIPENKSFDSDACIPLESRSLKVLIAKTSCGMDDKTEQTRDMRG